MGSGEAAPAREPAPVPAPEPAPATLPDGASSHGAGQSDDRPRTLLITIVVLALIMNTIARGVTETFAVFLLAVQDGLDASRGEITAAYSLYMVVLGISAPAAGQLVDRAGVRLTYGFGLVTLGGGYALAGFAETLVQYYLCVGLLGGLGGAAIGMVVASSLLSRWFTGRVGLIMAIPYAAVGLGMLVVPWVTQALLQVYGWRTVYMMLGVGTLAMFPLTMALPLSRMSRGSRSWRALRQRARAQAGGWQVSAAVRTGGFWGLFAAYFFTSVSAYAVLPQSVAYLQEAGFDPLIAAGAFGFTGALSVVGILSIGWLADAIGRKLALTLSYAMSITGIILLMAIATYPTLALVYGFVACFGLMQGARGPVILSYVTLLFPGGSVGAIFGTLSLALGLGAGSGSYLSGLLVEWTGAYTASFALGATASLLGLAMFLMVPALRRERALVRS
ncbi:MAG: MFS transporter [Pseudomonadota bacterium]